MKSKEIEEIISYSFKLTCPLCNQKYQQNSNVPMVICFRQHLCCQQCVNKKIFTNLYFNIDIGQCPQCRETIKRNQVNRLKIFDDILQLKRKLNEKIRQSKIEEQVNVKQMDKIEDKQGDQKLCRLQKLSHGLTRREKLSQLQRVQGWLLNEAENYFFQSKFEKAITICRSIIENNPYQRDAFAGFGGKQDFIGYEQDYIKQFYRQYMKENETRSPFDLLSLCLLLSSEYEEDKAWYTRQLELNEDNYQLHFGLGLLEGNFGNSDKAIEQYKIAVGINNDFQKAEQCIAFQYFAKNKLINAREYAEESLFKNPQNIYSLFIRAMTNKIQQQKIEQLIELSTKYPQYLVPLHELGQVYFFNGQIQKAIQCFTSCLKKSQVYDIARISLGLCYLQNELPETAIRLFQGTTMANDSQQALQIIAEAYCKMGLSKQAHEAVQKCKTINPDNQKIDYTQAGIFELQEKYDFAIDIYKKLLNKDPQQTGIYKLIAFAFLQKKDFYNALQWSEQFQKLEPQDTQILLRIADAYYSEGQIQQALENYLQCFKINGQLQEFTSKIIDIYIKKHMYEEALEWAKKWNDIQPQNPDSWEAISSISKIIGDKIRSKQWQPKKRRHLN